MIQHILVHYNSTGYRRRKLSDLPDHQQMAIGSGHNLNRSNGFPNYRNPISGRDNLPGFQGHQRKGHRRNLSKKVSYDGA